MAHSLIAGDAAFAVVLAAWWQLRRSAHLLPHLRRGPSSFFFSPGYGFVSWIMAIITLPPLLIIRRRRRRRQRPRQVAVENGHVVRSTGVPDPTYAAAARLGLKPGPQEWGPEELGWVTAPIPVPAGLRPTPPAAHRSMPSSTLRPGPEPPTCPLPVVGPRASGHTTLPIGAQVGPAHSEGGPGYVEPPTRPAVARRGAA